VFEIPAGRLDRDESPETCAHRELREETGYSAGELIHLTTFYTTPGFTDERIHVFAAAGLDAGEAQKESDEILDLAVIPLSEAVAMVQDGRLVDGKSMVGLLFARFFLRKQ
jgi:ADP-ribose pyrophosphatase